MYRGTAHPPPWRYANLGVRVAPEYQFRSLYGHRRDSYSWAHKLAEGRPLGYGGMQWIACPEHHCRELIPSENARDLRPWYEAGRHPRWSLMATLLGPLKQRLGEANRFLNLDSWGQGQTVVDVLKRWPGQGAFVRAMRPHVWVWLSADGRKYRVPASVAHRARTRTFTLVDFANELSSNLRQLMIGRGVTVAALLQHGTLGEPFGAEVVNGVTSALYTMRSQRYLVVGTTLHRVARMYYETGSGWIEIDTPAAARTWLDRQTQKAKTPR